MSSSSSSLSRLPTPKPLLVTSSEPEKRAAWLRGRCDAENLDAPMTGLLLNTGLAPAEPVALNLLADLSVEEAVDLLGCLQQSVAPGEPGIVSMGGGPSPTEALLTEALNYLELVGRVRTLANVVDALEPENLGARRRILGEPDFDDSPEQERLQARLSLVGRTSWAQTLFSNSLVAKGLSSVLMRGDQFAYDAKESERGAEVALVHAAASAVGLRAKLLDNPEGSSGGQWLLAFGEVHRYPSRVLIHMAEKTAGLGITFLATASERGLHKSPLGRVLPANFFRYTEEDNSLQTTCN